MASKNDITGDSLKSKGPSKNYDQGWERIFGKPCHVCGLKGQHKMDCPENYPRNK